MAKSASKQNQINTSNFTPSILILAFLLVGFIPNLEAVDKITSAIADLRIEIDADERVIKSYKENMKSTRTEHLEALTDTDNNDMTANLYTA